jgi:hypothetical protein
MEWLWLKFIEALAHQWFSAAAIGLVLGMGAIEFTARMLPANTSPTVATRVSWVTACAASFGVAFLLNTSAMGFAIALTVGVGSPSAQLMIMRFLYARYPSLKPQSMADNFRACPPPGEVKWPP